MNPQDARIWVERTQESGQDAGGAERGGLAMGRLVQVSIAIWLLPALLMVLVVGAFGFLVLDAGRRFTDVLTGQACHPRNSAGLESFR